MSLGYGVGDCIAVTKLAWSVYKSCKDAPESFSNISTEVASLHAVLSELAEAFESERLPEARKARLTTIFQRLQWGLRWNAGDVAELRARLTSHTVLFQTFLGTLQFVIQRKLESYAQEFQRGEHEPSVISNQTSDTISQAQRDTWRDIRKELEGIGISVEAFQMNKEFIKTWLQDELLSGIFEEVSPENEPGSDFEPRITTTESSRSRSSNDQLSMASDLQPLDNKAINPHPKPNSHKNGLQKATGRIGRFYALIKGLDRVFLTACEEGDYGTALKLLRSGANIDAHNARQGTAFISALKRKNMKTAKWLLIQGANINSIGRNGTALQYAITQKNHSYVSWLIEQKANVHLNSRSYEDNSLLCIAVKTGDRTVVELLINAGLNINKESFSHARQCPVVPLIIAVTCKDATMVKLLLDRGADIDIQTHWIDKLSITHQSTPLWEALGFELDADPIMHLLLSKGASTNIRIHGETPLIYSVGRGRTDTVQALLTHGAQIHARKRNVTALELAIEKEARCYRTGLTRPRRGHPRTRQREPNGLGAGNFPCDAIPSSPDFLMREGRAYLQDHEPPCAMECRDSMGSYLTYCDHKRALASRTGALVETAG
ncbi:het domain protein [Phlyctema vagabunda]|uniref:Het domain protein n=1 Tax=Phlyctema vagabunda TaxID=108571 RepID=A0ABR4PI46_9HELO